MVFLLPLISPLTYKFMMLIDQCLINMPSSDWWFSSRSSSATMASNQYPAKSTEYLWSRLPVFHQLYHQSLPLRVGGSWLAAASCVFSTGLVFCKIFWFHPQPKIVCQQQSRRLILIFRLIKKKVDSKEHLFSRYTSNRLSFAKYSSDSEMNWCREPDFLRFVFHKAPCESPWCGIVRDANRQCSWKKKLLIFSFLNELNILVWIKFLLDQNDGKLDTLLPSDSYPVSSVSNY